MVRPQKFGLAPQTPEPFCYPNIWARQQTSGPDRLVIAPDSDHIELMRTLSSVLNPPLGVLYILLVPRQGSPAGRYQGTEPLSLGQAEDFLTEFRDFFEHDGRHHLWIAATDGSGLLVYDNHNVIYAYGPLDRFTAVLSEYGLAEVQEVQYPSPHFHNFNASFDSEETRLMEFWQWFHSPLHDSDDA